jgi:hypothetical protein
MEKSCKNCGNEFKTYNSKRKFCSRKCFFEWLKRVSVANDLGITLNSPFQDHEEVKEDANNS